MGGQYSHLVFQPCEQPSYDDKLEGLEWIDASSTPIELEREANSTPNSTPGSPTETRANNNNNDNNETTITISKKEKELIPFVFYEWKSKEGESAMYTLLYSPTTAGNVDMGKHIPWLLTMRDVLHVNVATFEYSGYGLLQSQKPSEKSCYENIRVAYNHLTITKGISSDKIILMGKSLGTGPAINLAANLYGGLEAMKSFKKSLSRKMTRGVSTKELSLFKGFAGVILQSPMTSIIDISNDKRLSIISADVFENSDKISKIKCPFLVIHGAKDQVVDISHSKKLCQKISGEFLWKFLIIEEAGHDDIETEYDDDILDDSIDFINYLSPDDSSKKVVTVSIPSQYVSADRVITRWLTTIGMEKFTSIFVSFGYYDLVTVKSIDEIDLDGFGVSEDDDRKILLQEISKLRDMSPSQLKELSTFFENGHQRSSSSSSADEVGDFKRRASVADVKERKDKEHSSKENRRKNSNPENKMTRPRSNSDEGKKKESLIRGESISNFIKTRLKRDKSKRNVAGTYSPMSSGNPFDKKVNQSASLDMKTALKLSISGGVGLESSNNRPRSPHPDPPEPKRLSTPPENDVAVDDDSNSV